MNQIIINSAIIICCFVIVVSSYKSKINKKNYILLYTLLFISNILIVYFIYPGFEKWMYILAKIIVYYILLKLTYRDKANLLDVFYLIYFILINEVLMFSIKNIFIERIIIIILSILCKIFEENLKMLNDKIITTWNGKDDKSLTLRCIFVITFNISFYIICKIL